MSTMHRKEQSTQFNQGYAAYFAGTAFRSCPYPVRTWMWVNWRDGFIAARYDACVTPLVDIGCANLAVDDGFRDR